MAAFLSKKLSEQAVAVAESAPKIAPIAKSAHSEAHIIPLKRRASPKIAQLRRQLWTAASECPKLLMVIDEADGWKRGDVEKENMLVGRLQRVIEKLNIQITSPEFQELSEAMLNDLLGFGAIEPLVQNRKCSEIMVNGPDV